MWLKNNDTIDDPYKTLLLFCLPPGEQRISPAFTCSLGCGGGGGVLLVGVVEYEKVGLPAEKTKKKESSVSYYL